MTEAALTVGPLGLAFGAS